MLRTNRDRTRLVVLLERTSTHYTYKQLIPVLGRTAHHTLVTLKRYFERAYPVAVDGVELDKEATRAYGVAEGRLYTDGEIVTFVERLHINRVVFWEVFPRVRGNYEMTTYTFLDRFPWDIDELE